MTTRFVQLLVCLCVVLIVTASFAGATRAYKEQDLKKDLREEPLKSSFSEIEQLKIQNRKIKLTEDMLDQLNELVNTIKEDKIKQKMLEVIEKVVTPEGELDVDTLEIELQNYYNVVRNIVCDRPVEIPFTP